MRKMALVILTAFIAVTLQANENETMEARVYTKADFSRFKEGANIFPEDGAFQTFGKIPKEYQGRMITMNCKLPEEPLKFKVKQAGVVNLVVDKRVSDGLNSEGWRITGKVRIQETGNFLFILEKELEEGEYTFDEGINRYVGLRLLKK
jgi:hypothetical protein